MCSRLCHPFVIPLFFAPCPLSAAMMSMRRMIADLRSQGLPLEEVGLALVNTHSVSDFHTLRFTILSVLQLGGGLCSAWSRLPCVCRHPIACKERSGGTVSSCDEGRAARLRCQPWRPGLLVRGASWRPVGLFLTLTHALLPSPCAFSAPHSLHHLHHRLH